MGVVSVRWLNEGERAAWIRLAAVAELLPAALDSQLRRDADLTHFEYWVVSMLSEAPERTLRMTELAARTNATLPRLSHVARRLEQRGLIERFPCPQDRRATNARLTAPGWEKVVATAPGHVAAVRQYAIDALSPEQLAQLVEIGEAILARLDTGGAVTGHYRQGRPSQARPAE